MNLGPYFIIDASSQWIQVGILQNNQWLGFQKTTDPALEGIFNCIESVLIQSKKNLTDIDSIFYCEGPGPTLPLRLVATAINTWKTFPEFKNINLFSFSNLYLCAHILQKNFSTQNFNIGIEYSAQKIAYINQSTVFPHIEKISFNEFLEKSQLTPSNNYLISQRKQWSTPPMHIQLFPYDLERYPSSIHSFSYYVEKLSAELYTPGETAYKQWDQKIHHK